MTDQAEIVPSGAAAVKTELTGHARDIAILTRLYDDAKPSDREQIDYALAREPIGRRLIVRPDIVRFLLRSDGPMDDSQIADALTRRYPEQ